MLVGSIMLILGLLPQVTLGSVIPRASEFFWGLYFLILIFTTYQAAIAARGALICNDLLARSLCPACGYDLSGLGPDPPPSTDGCSTCPECGAAWKLGGEPSKTGEPCRPP